MSKLNCFADIIFSWILLVSMRISFKPTLQVKESLKQHLLQEKRQKKSMKVSKNEGASSSTK